MLCLFVSIPGHGENIPAPEFPEKLQWLNVSRPLTLDDLKGRVTILDFWTYGCINCLHVVEELWELEKKYGDSLLVIGVHSPKFSNERRMDTLRRILLRYDRQHPVIQDRDLELMQIYGVRAWPTLMVIDTKGMVIGYLAGEGHGELLDDYIAKLLKARDTDTVPPALPLQPEAMRIADQPLAAPGKIISSEGDLIISDTLHHRIIVTREHDDESRIIGEGVAGFRDGPLEQARFAYPQGMVRAGESLFVADTGNHALRHVDLNKGTVSTIAGIGEVGYELHPSSNATSVSLRSPWDLALLDSNLYIAMAGSYQVWRLDLDTGKIEPFAGSGKEGLENGALKEATFSQPSGLALSGRRLYVADAEASAIREIDLETRTVKTLLGTGLFDFGDEDGVRSETKLQHPLAVSVLDKNQLLIADTYNHKIKVYELETGKTRTLVGNGQPGDGTEIVGASLNEPGGIAVNGDRVWVADTNNDRIIRFDRAGKRLISWSPHKKKR
ncbi:thioredoxin-like domain-containing protein [Solemya velesiana gill symbiont]|uniref:thioredoxin-like domain-containing protein n=1 Tax=Solemya velesiana gill symbiont TaxID=1918948 RepID=UPI0015611FEC|nr:thioredoxin-like domain-containing protein [Solemya velesiana gill symbiont]